MGRNVEPVKAAYAAFAVGDIPTVLGLMQHDIRWEEAENSPYDGSTAVGPDAVVEEVFMKLGSEWDGFTVTVEELLDCGDRVVAVGRYSGTYKQTGEPLDAQLVHIWTVRDGKLATFNQYTDTLQYAAVTGTRNREIRRPTGIS
jgi:uncharacterized protein